MFLDAQKGQPIEVEVILGEVVRMAKERNVNVPVGSMGAFPNILIPADHPDVSASKHCMHCSSWFKPNTAEDGCG